MSMLFEILLAIGVAVALLGVDHIFQFSNKAIDKTVKQASEARKQNIHAKQVRERDVDNERV